MHTIHAEHLIQAPHVKYNYRELVTANIVK